MAFTALHRQNQPKLLRLVMTTWYIYVYKVIKMISIQSIKIASHVPIHSKHPEQEQKQ